MDSTTPTTTGTPTATTPAAAPATSAPSSAVATPERPTSFAEAFARDAAVHTETPSAPDGTATTAQAETTPVDGALNPSVKPGEPPQEKWPQILDNARAKARAEVEAEFQQKHGWALNADRAAVEEASRLGQLYQTDRAGYLRQVLTEAAADPTLAQMVRSEAARVLGSRQVQAPASVPDIPIVNEQGQVVGNLREIVQQQLTEYAAKELAPYKSDLQQRQDRAKAEAADKELHTAVQDIHSEALDVLPGFKEHEAEIAKVFATIPGDPAKALRAAWKQVVGGKLGLTDQIKASTLDELKTKAAASQVNPASAVVAATSRPKSFHDKSLKW